ncbi:MAG: hypothetical protein JEZ06_05450 [Anaerolineaceae bacterium]|nr:hypothetical protein [Anaerolineaceae bacterium]
MSHYYSHRGLAAEIADLLFRLQGVKWAICKGVFEEELIISVRSRSQKLAASDLAQKIVKDLGTAGGHETMAGGHIRLNKREPIQLSNQLTRKILENVKGDDSMVGYLLV